MSLNALAADPGALAASSHPRIFSPAGVNVTMSSVELWWIPLGAGGHFVRLNGRIYEWIRARREGRAPLDLYHSALVVHVPEGRFVIENAWPIPDGQGASRGVVVEGPVFSRGLGRFRFLRYEVRRWQDGVIFDVSWARPPQIVTTNTSVAKSLLELVPSVPARIWGRDEGGAGEMWNSNSVISWLLATSGVPLAAVTLPPFGRAPGWEEGIAMARLRTTPSPMRLA